MGYDEGGQLTEAIRRKPHAIILLDEIEKAHPDVFNILLQIFDDGHLTDAKGRKVDFRNAVVIMTSNLGSDLIKKDTNIGFSVKKDAAVTFQDAYERMKDKVTAEVKRFFRPEFLNRIDATVVFHALARHHIINIVDLMLDQVRVQLREHGVNMEVTPEAKEFLAEKGYDPDYGARPLRRVIQDKVEDLLSEELLTHKFSPGDTAVLDVVDGKIVVHSKEMAVSS